MKILCVMPNYWPAVQFGGPIFCIHDLNKALIRKGIDLTVYTTNAGLRNRVQENIPVYVDRVNVTYFKVNKVFDFLGDSGWQYSKPLTEALRDNMKSFDLVYIVYVWNYPVAAASHYARKYKIPYIISPIGTLYSETRAHNSWKKIPYYKIVSEKDLRGASAIHYTTFDELEKCHKSLKLRNQTIVVPNGLDSYEFENLPRRDSLTDHYEHLRGKKIILFLGRISWKKGLDILIKAFSEVYKKNKDTHLLLVGNDDEGYSEKLKNIIITLNLSYIDMSPENNHKSSVNVSSNDKSCITFTGILEGENRLKAFAGSDMFVLSSYSENFGMSVIEAMASKTPVIISNNVGIYREVERNNAGIVIENTVEELASAMETLLENENLSNELSQNGYQLVSELYDINKVAGSMINAFVDIIGARS